MAKTSLAFDDAIKVVHRHFSKCFSNIRQELGNQFSPGDSDFVSNDEFISYLKAALLSQEGTNIAFQLREIAADSDGSLTRKSRDELSAILQQLLSPLCEQFDSEAKALHESVAQLRKEIDALLNERLDVKRVMVPGPFMDRFNEEYPRPKKMIAERVASTYFQESVRCFLQASTTIMHLAEAL